MKFHQISNEARISIVHEVMVGKLKHDEVAIKYGVATSVVNSLVWKSRKRDNYL